MRFPDLDLASRILVNIIHASTLHGEFTVPLEELAEKLTRLYLYGVTNE